MILAGGRGSRLNGDKALAPFAGASLLDAVLSRLRGGKWAGPAAINANGDPARFARFGLPVLADCVPDFPGPLAGILTAIEWAASRPDRAWNWVATVPTDTPLLPRGLMDRMQEAVHGAAEDMIICAESPSGLHPVIALWPLGLRDGLREAVTITGIRCVRDVLASQPLRRLMFGNSGSDAFLNVNSAAQLAAAEALWSGGNSAAAEE